jgi:hypothetical protein
MFSPHRVQIAQVHVECSICTAGWQLEHLVCVRVCVSVLLCCVEWYVWCVWPLLVLVIVCVAVRLMDDLAIAPHHYTDLVFGHRKQYVCIIRLRQPPQSLMFFVSSELEHARLNWLAMLPQPSLVWTESLVFCRSCG